MTAPSYSKIIQLVRKYVPAELVNEDILLKAYRCSKKYLKSSLNIDMDSGSYGERSLTTAFEIKLDGIIKKNDLSEFRDLFPRLHKEALIATISYSRKIIPWALANNYMSAKQLDAMIFVIYCSQVSYEIIEDTIDSHCQLPKMSIIYIPDLSNIINFNISELLGSSKTAVSYLRRYHKEYIFSEIAESERDRNGAMSLWEKEKLISYKASPAKMLYAIPLIIAKKEYLIKDYEEINDQWTLFLQTFDDMVDLNLDIGNGKYGLVVGLLDWLRTNKNMTHNEAFRSVTIGTGYKMLLENSMRCLDLIIRRSVRINDMLMAYSAYERRYLVTSAIQAQKRAVIG
jgi:hypothetical protein